MRLIQTDVPRIPILDPGHGLLYALAGGRKIADDKGLFCEGEFNRAVVNRVIEILVKKQIPFFVTTVDHEDMDLDERVRIANDLYEQQPGLYFLSVHSNAGGGVGCEVYTSPGETTSDKIATHFGLMFQQTDLIHWGLRKDTTDGDLDKEHPYRVLTHTISPAILWEFFFFDVAAQRHMLLDPVFRQKIVDFLVAGIEILYQGKMYVL